MSSQSNTQTECYVYRSKDGVNWKRGRGPFPPSQAQQVAQQEERELKAYQDATRQPNGAYRTYAIRITCFNPGDDVPEELVDDQRQNYGFLGGPPMAS
jgi:hypothetical protein